MRSAGTVHERGTSALVAVVAAADRPSPAVRAALNGGRLAARELDQQAQRWEHDPERAAALVLARSVRAGHTAARGQTPALRVAVVVVLGGTVTLVTTDESMGAVLTVGGTVLRPVPVRPAAPGGASSLHSVSSTESDAATAVIASPTPPSSRDAAAAERLPDLCRRLSTTSDAARAVAGFEHDHYGATGTPAVVLALVHDAVLPTTTSRR